MRIGWTFPCNCYVAFLKILVYREQINLSHFILFTLFCRFFFRIIPNPDKGPDSQCHVGYNNQALETYRVSKNRVRCSMLLIFSELSHSTIRYLYHLMCLPVRHVLFCFVFQSYTVPKLLGNRSQCFASFELTTRLYGILFMYYVTC